MCSANVRQHDCRLRAQLTFDVFGWLVGPKLRNSLHFYEDLKEVVSYETIGVKLLTVSEIAEEQLQDKTLQQKIIEM